MSAQSGLTGPRLLAVLFADVHGYTRLVERDEAGTVARLARSLALIRGLVGDYGGSVVFRIGISVGRTFAGADGVYGHSVNLAARIQGFAAPGGICVTGPVRRLLGAEPGLALHPLGRKRLKNISAPVEVFAVEPGPAAPQPAAAAAPAPAPPEAGTGGPPEASLAILPLENISGDPGDLHLCRGIVADLTTNLCRFRNLMVIARRSAFLAAADAGTLRGIGRRLGVRYLLSGSFRRAENRIRITFDLIEAETESTLWSERYDGVMADIFDLQDDAAAMTAARLAIRIEAAERRRLAGQGHPALYAYGLVLRGQDLDFRFRPEVNLHARRLFRQAQQLDPHYGRSYAALSRTFNVEWRYNWAGDPQAALDRALALARRAVECDGLDARGFSELGLAYLYKKQHDEALAAYEHALELNPNDADLLAYAGDCLAYVRQGARAVRLIERAIRLNPYHPDAYLWFLGDAHFHMGDYAKAIEALSRMQDRSEAHRLLAASHALLGRMDEARHHAREVMRVHPNFTIEHWQKVPPLRHGEDLHVFVEALRMAGLH